MFYRRVLRVSANLALLILMIATSGLLLWVTDNAVGWNILPDWLEGYAQVIVMFLTVLASIAIIMAVLCSIVLSGEASAERAGIPPPPSETKLLRKMGAVLGVFVLIIFALSRYDQFRAKELEAIQKRDYDAAMRKEKLEREKEFLRLQQAFQSQIPSTLNLFSETMRQKLTVQADVVVFSDDSDLGKLLNSLSRSLPEQPDLSIMVRARSPYRYCVLEFDQEKAGKGFIISRTFFTSLPSKWEHQAVQEIFDGKEFQITKAIEGMKETDRIGNFFTNHIPQAYGKLKSRNKVVGILLLEGNVN